MKKGSAALILCASVLATGCSAKFWGGAASGVAGAGAGYEVHAKQELDHWKKALDRGDINQQEYDIRKDQIQRDSLFQ